MPNVISVQIIRPGSMFSMRLPLLPASRVWVLWIGDEDEDQGDDEGVQRDGLGHADADEHVGADVAGHLGLAGDGLERLADHDARGRCRGRRRRGPWTVRRRAVPEFLAACGSIDVLLQGLCVMVSVVLVECAADVHGGENGEDEGLDEGDEDLEHVDQHGRALQGEATR